jgi:hypothetical protein
MFHAFVICAKTVLSALAMMFTKHLNVLISNCQRRNKDHCALFNLLPNWQIKNKEAL